MTNQLLGNEESKIDLGDLDGEELASLVALANQGIDCSDRGDRDGLREAAGALAKQTRQKVGEQGLRAVPGAMRTESWVRGLLLARNLLQLKKLSWSQCGHAVARYFASIRALRDPETTAFETLLDASTPYPHLRIHHEMQGDSMDNLDATSREITRHAPPWGDAPLPPAAVTVEEVWETARAWTNAREAKDWSGAVSLKRALQEALGQADVPELRELLTMPDAKRRARMRTLGLLPKEDWATAPSPVVPSHGSACERVTHAKFGAGEVISREGSGELAILEVRFDDAVRKLQAKFVRPIA